MTSDRARHLQRQLTPYYFLLPVMVVLTVVIIYPVFSDLVMSLQRVRLMKGGDEFVGLANYVRLLRSSTFIGSIGSSARFTLISLPLALLMGLAMALVFNEIRKYRPIFTGFLLMPWAIAPVVTGYMWRWLFHDSFGLINYFLIKLGLLHHNVAWLAQPDTAMAAVIVANIWRFMPYITLMLLAGLQGIPAELYEAAHVDGATVLQRLWYVTLPQLRHVMSVVFLFATIWMVNDFGLIFIMTEGGPANATQVLPITVYRIAFEHLRLGRAAAAALILLSLLLVLSIIFVRVLFGGRRATSED